MDEGRLADQVAAWLNSQGFRLEHQAYTAFRTSGLEAGLGLFVESADGKRREIDTYAWTGILRTRSGRKCIVRAICECKYSKDKPWVLMQGDLPANIFVDWSCLPKSPNLRRADQTIEQHAHILQATPHFQSTSQCAYSLLEALGPANRDAAYDSLKKICDAAWDVAEAPSRAGDQQILIVVIPCLIVDGPLFEARFDAEAGSFQIQEVGQGRISWQGCRGGTVVDVVQAKALNEYAAGLRLTFKAVRAVLNEFS